MIGSTDQQVSPSLRRGLLKKLLLSVLILALVSIEKSFAQADWVKFGTDGKLVYKQDTKGNRVMDFSNAGYMGGGVSLPDVPVKVNVNASSGDRTAAIQTAINQVAAMPLVNGFRGTVLLGPGTYN